MAYKPQKLGIADGGSGVSTTPTNGQLMIGNGTGYTIASLTAGANITITPGAGSISIAASGGGGGINIGDAVGGGASIGSVLFVGAGTLVAQDNADLFWDETNNRLGLGTATPSQTLDIGGKFQVVGTTGGVIITDDQASISLPTIGATAQPIILLGATTGGNNRMVLAYSASSPTYGMRFDDGASSSLIHFTQSGAPFASFDIINARVGIGVASPLNQFDVDFDMYTSKSILLTSDANLISFPTNAGTAGPMITMGATASGFTRAALAYNTSSPTYGLLFEDASQARMHFAVAGTPFATFDLTSGRVGIGVAAPTSSFQVGFDMTTNSNIIFTSDAKGITLPAITGGATSFVDLGSTSSTNTRMLFSYGTGSPNYGLRYDDTGTASFNFTSSGTSFACFQIINGRTGFGTTSPTHFVEISGGNLAISSAGNGIRIAEGTNATMGITTLSGGTQTVSTTEVTANSRIFLTIQNPGGVVGSVYVSTRTAGTSFDITSTSAADTSDVGWLIIEPT